VRLLHTADWHLGRLFHGTHLTDDQAHLLAQFIDLVADQRPDAILISGDIYDRSVPPVEAVELLNETLCQIIVDYDIPILVIAGNHDNPARLEFLSKLLSRQGLYLFGTLASCGEPVSLEDEHGTVTFFSAPYCEPVEVRDHLGDDSVQCFDSAMGSLVGTYRINGRSVLLGHAFVSGGSVTESERPLNVGGAETVSVSHFDPFSYVALGHLHQPQAFNNSRVRYSGSLMKYSFSEANQRKSVSMVEIDATGGVRIEELTLTPRRDLRVISGYLNDLLQNPDDFGPRNDYLMANLLDEGAVYDAMGRLREVFPNLMHLERSNLFTDDAGRRSVSDIAGKDDLELFNDFMQAMTGKEMSAEQSRSFLSVVDEVRRDEREGGA
jgi:DNA repair protein SbcD/Mre11